MDHIFFDVETTALDTSKAEIIDIAAVRTNGEGDIIATFNTKVRPKGAVDPNSARINGYDELDWQGAPSFLDAFKALKFSSLLAYANPAVVVAHGAPFDRAVFANNCQREGVTDLFAKSRWIDTCQLLWPLKLNGSVDSLSLEKVAKYFFVRNPAPHTALGDAETLRLVYWRYMQRTQIMSRVEDTARGIGEQTVKRLFSFVTDK